jgi:hypothetical protein
MLGLGHVAIVRGVSGPRVIIETDETDASALLVVAALCAASARAAGAEDLTIVSTVTTPRGTTRTQTQYLSSSRMRCRGTSATPSSTSSRGRSLILDNRRKEYSATTLDELRAFLDQIDSAMAGRPIVDGTVGAHGQRDRREGHGRQEDRGYDTEQYILTMGESMRVEVFMTTALEPPARYFDARKVAYASRGPMARPFVRLYDEMKKIKGFPLATSLDQRMRVTRRQVSTEATEVRKGPIPDSVFAAPSDYKKVESPFGGGRPPRPRPSP